MDITIHEVGPRDGLQNEARFVPTELKIRFVDALSACGLPEIEVSSFVSPEWVPQLADAEAVFRGITRAPGVRYLALVPNERGLERALRAGAVMLPRSRIVAVRRGATTDEVLETPTVSQVERGDWLSDFGPHSGRLSDGRHHAREGDA